jgi:hypothetical protein
VGRKAGHGPGSHQGCVQRGRPTVNIGGIPICRPRAARIGARHAPPRTQANFGPGPCWPANFLFLFSFSFFLSFFSFLFSLFSSLLIFLFSVSFVQIFVFLFKFENCSYF